jgi:TatA/E family protein of Tat protein translocase
MNEFKIVQAFVFPVPAEMAIIAGVGILIFGPKLFVKWAKSLGETIRENRKALKEIHEDTKLLED